MCVVESVKLNNVIKLNFISFITFKTEIDDRMGNRRCKHVQAGGPLHTHPYGACRCAPGSGAYFTAYL